MLLKKHNCKSCGSSNIESYKDENYLYIKCENCGNILHKHALKMLPMELARLKYRAQNPIRSSLPLFIGIIILAAIFGIVCRYVFVIFGVFL